MQVKSLVLEKRVSNLQPTICSLTYSGLQSFVSIPHTKRLHFCKLLPNCIIKCCSKWLSVVNFYCLNQNHKVKPNILVVYSINWRVKGKKLEKWCVLFVSKPHLYSLGTWRLWKWMELCREMNHTKILLACQKSWPKVHKWRS